ncbi:MAG: hypothetical protein Q9190_006048 [Brigantiaea leucoxantha]
MEDECYPNVVYGSLVSLYDDLTHDEILVLEKAIAHRNLRNFDKSLALFQSFPVSTAVKPAIALEQTWTLIAQPRYKDAQIVAERASSYAPYETCSTNFLPTLWRAILAGLDVVMDKRGANAQSTTTMIRTSLLHIPLEAYTDIQVWLVNIYYYILSISSNPKKQPADVQLPQPPDDQPTQIGITLLREHLQSMGRLTSALFLLETEFPFLVSKDAEIEALESLRSAASLQPEGSNQPISYIEGRTSLKLAHIYAEFGDKEGYCEMLFDASASLSAPGDSEAHSNLLRTDTWLARLELAKAEESEEPVPEVEDWQQFAEYAEGVGDFRAAIRGLDEEMKIVVDEEREGEGKKDVVKKRLEHVREQIGVPNGLPVRKAQVLALSKRIEDMAIVPSVPDQSDINSVVIDQRGIEEVDATA